MSSGIRNVMGRSILKSESEAESDDLKRLSMYFFDRKHDYLGYNYIEEKGKHFQKKEAVR